jgi:hypothetical protein
VANTPNLFRNGAVGFIVLLDLFGFHLTLRMILEYPSGTAQQKTDNYDADDRARRRVRDEPPIKLQDDDKDEHGNNRESTTAKNEKREHAGDGSYDSGRCDNNRGNQWCMLKVLLGKKLVPLKTTCAWSVIEEVLNAREHASKYAHERERDRCIASVWNALVRVVIN